MRLIFNNLCCLSPIFGRITVSTLACQARWNTSSVSPQVTWVRLPAREFLFVFSWLGVVESSCKSTILYLTSYLSGNRCMALRMSPTLIRISVDEKHIMCLPAHPHLDTIKWLSQVQISIVICSRTLCRHEPLPGVRTWDMSQITLVQCPASLLTV